MSVPLHPPAPAPGTTALSGHDDGVLIELYRTERDQEAMRTLVERHHDPIYRRLRRELFDETDAEVCSQRLWIRVTRQLDDYRDDGDFPRFLWTLASEVIEEHRQRLSAGPHRGAAGGDAGGDVGGDADGDIGGNAGGQSAPRGERAAPRARDGTDPDDELVERLVHELIPALPVEQRAAWLLRHESDARQPGRRLEWKHLAELNGVDVGEAWALFESARGRLIGGARSASSTVLDEEEMLVFLVWTQAQRAAGTERFSWDYAAELLGVPVGTLKGRYRAAEERLADALGEYRRAR